MRKILISALAGLMAASASAATYNRLVVSLHDGSSVEINLSSELKMQFDDQNLLVTDGESQVAIERANIKSFAHDDLGSVNGLENKPGFEQTGDVINFRNLPAASQIALYSASGALQLSAQADGEYSLPLSGVAAGNYILVVNNISYKIRIK